MQRLDNYQQNPSQCAQLEASEKESFGLDLIEKYELIMPFLMSQCSFMKQNYPRISAQLARYQVSISFQFPEETQEGDLLVSNDCFESAVQLSYDPKEVDARAISIAYYLIGQYQIVCEAIQQIDELFQAMEDDDEDEEEGSEEDEPEEE